MRREAGGAASRAAGARGPPRAGAARAVLPPLPARGRRVPRHGRRGDPAPAHAPSLRVQQVVQGAVVWNVSCGFRLLE